MPITPISTDSNTEYYDKWYVPQTPWPKLNGPNWAKVNCKYSFDVNKLLNCIKTIEETRGFKPFQVDKDRWRWTYQGIGLTSRPNAKEPMYDALSLFSKNGELNISETFNQMKMDCEHKIAPALYEKHFTEKTEIYSGYIKDVLDAFNLPKCKVRVLNLKPKGVITPHVDFPYYKQIRLHAVLQTNKDVWWECEGERFQLPADGNWYWFDTGKCHAVWNDGDSDRLVLSLNLSIYEDLYENPTNQGRDFYELIASEDL